MSMLSRLFAQLDLPFVPFVLLAALPLIAILLLLIKGSKGGVPRSTYSPPRVEILTVEDVAKACDVSSKVVQQWANNGLAVVCPSKGIVLVRPQDLEKFFADNLAVSAGG